MKKYLQLLLLPVFLIFLSSCEKEESIFNFSDEQVDVFNAFDWDFSKQGILKVEKITENISNIWNTTINV